MRKLFLIFLMPLSVLLAHAQMDTLLLPYDATSLTTEQQASNPSVLAYPTSIRDQMPGMFCAATFTIDEQGHKVEFSPGNLQYQASTGLWRFAEHQWDYVGDATRGTVYENGVKCDNALIGDDYTGWIDLFAWGTSGWYRRAEYYEPTSTSTDRFNRDHYYVGQRASNNLEGDYANADWGVYNQIGNDPPNTWRTLSKAQWEYLINQRPNSENLWGWGEVNGVNGFILLPDKWITVNGVSFVPAGGGVDINIYTIAEWDIMERQGAVFLPKAGQRRDRNVNTGVGYYWSTTANTTNADYPGNKTIYIDAYSIRTSDSFGISISSEMRCYGLSVRLVKDL
ncbi:MAG: hypothetical protein IK073_03755 [Paludibacteraceae bacterium]|nr:hypothetical protein [Paludibacteraceae bacterium]